MRKLFTGCGCASDVVPACVRDGDCALNAAWVKPTLRLLWPVLAWWTLAPAAVAASAPAQYFVKRPAGTLTYEIVLTGHYDHASPAGTPVTQQFHDQVTIHRTLEVSATMYRVPTETSPDCGQACGDDWSEKALQQVASAGANCGGDYTCAAKAMQAASAETTRITRLANLQSLAADGPTWAAMRCSASASIDDTETLAHYVYADEAGTDQDPGTVTSRGNQTGSVKAVDCAHVLDAAYAIYLTAPASGHGYVLQLPPFSIPTIVTNSEDHSSDSSSAGVSNSDLRDSTIRLGDDGTPLPLPAAGQPYSGKQHIETLFKADSTPVFHRSAFIPVSADISWRFIPQPPAESGTPAGRK